MTIRDGYIGKRSLLKLASVTRRSSRRYGITFRISAITQCCGNRMREIAEVRCDMISGGSFKLVHREGFFLINTSQSTGVYCIDSSPQVTLFQKYRFPSLLSSCWNVADSQASCAVAHYCISTSMQLLTVVPD